MKLYLIDGNSYVYRAYYAIRELSNSKGFPTNAIFGFTNMLLKIIREKKPDEIAISFDSPVPTERHRLFNEYKANRPEAPSDLIQQLPHIRRIVAALKIKTFEIPGYEADDIIGTIAKKAAASGKEVYIVTGDKDMLQLIDDGIKIYDPVKDRILDKTYTIERYGLTPDRIPEFMALTGDAIDNIPGVKGIGEKTAKELLQQFRSLDELLKYPEKIKKEKLRKLISENNNIITLSRQLATIRTSVPIEDDLKDLNLPEPDWDLLRNLFIEFEFSSLMKLIPSKTDSINYEIILEAEKLHELIPDLKNGFAIDIEATNRNPVSADIVGIALCFNKDKGFYVPIGHSYQGAPEQLGKKLALEILRPLLIDKDIPKIGHNLKYDFEILQKEGMNIEGILYDTMLASYLLNPNKPGHNLEDSANLYLSKQKKPFTEVLGDRKSFGEVSLDEAAPYACKDALLSFELKEMLFEEIRKQDLEPLYKTIEMPLIRVLADMEMTGIKINPVILYGFSNEIESEMEAIKRRIYFIAGEEFNINSPKQLSKILFESLGLQPGKKKKTGYSTEMSVLEELANYHELPREILNYRSLSKLKTTYIDVLPSLVNPLTGRVHTSFNQTVTATGRLSSSEPNLQNIPVKGEWGKRIREAFISEGENFLISADYSQVELRILAHLSGDEGLLDAFKNNIDIHARTASEILNIPVEKITSDARRIAKTVNFGIIYGISPFGLSQSLGISTEEARDYIEKYFNRHPGVKLYMDNCINDARCNGYVSTLFGRKRAIPEIQSTNNSIRQQGERLAINTPVQGTAADIIKLAMIKIHEKLYKERFKTKMILQVHDELLFESPPDELNKIVSIIKEEMENTVNLSVPLVVDIHTGKNWAEAH